MIFFNKKYFTFSYFFQYECVIIKKSLFFFIINKEDIAEMLNTDLLKVKFLSKYTEQALEDYEADLRMKLLVGKNTVSSMAKLASLCFFKKDYDMAVYFFEKLMKLDATNGNWPGFLAYVYYEQEKYKKAIPYFEKSVDLSPNSPFIYFLLGNSYSRLGKIKEATWCYELAIFLDFDIYGAHVDFAKKYEKMGQKEKALEEYILAYEIDPRDKKIRKKIDALSE